MSTEKKDAILIIEDEVSLRTALHEKFVREGFTVYEAKDGRQGLAIALREQPQVILLDMMMPKLDGMALLELVRSRNTWGERVPVLLLTNVGADDKTIMKKIAADKATQYLVKSNWTMNQIVEKVREALA